MKGGADISDQLIIRQAVEAGEASAEKLSSQLQIPVAVAQDFIDYYSKGGSDKPLSGPASKKADAKPAKGKKDSEEDVFA